MTKNKLLFSILTVFFINSSTVFAAQQEQSTLVPTQQSKIETVATVATNSSVSEEVKPVFKKNKKKMRYYVANTNNARVRSLEKQVNNLETKIADLKQQQEEAKNGATWSNLYAYGPAVVTTPIVGKPAYDGDDLLVNLPYVNEDLALLKLNQKVERHYAKNNLKYPDRPVFMMSGMLEGWLYSYSKFNEPGKSGFNSGNRNNSTISLPTATLEGVARVNSWVSGVMRFEYQGDESSSLVLKRGYIVVGNFEKSPIYASAGKMFVPFGVYRNYMISDPLTKVIARTEGHPVVLGFNVENGSYGSVYALKGKTYKDGGNGINMWGVNLGYDFTKDKQRFDIGASYINNIADASGMLSNDYDIAGGFSGFNRNRQLQKQVPAAGVHALFAYQPVTVVAEYITTLSQFNKRDLSYNEDGARVRALDIEGIYQFNVIGKPSFVSAGYGRTWEALALNLPKHSYYVSVGTSVFKRTVQSIEYRRDVNYDSGDIATGASKPVMVGSKNRDQIIANFKVFF